ncbi:hypothetical protein BKA58DRAFT_377166 [Alternaria rosae]|uniref:uncharacterized protein n=1 Tax=Alternaria rosae TaxID=1187941 RepID=UPI001E8E8D40|nr:uncharacterized protein BKA58DRAFT_377166 [Alternaria rosae]KAH6878406.1 hypothetical protein BKA58DRAFT_377166 [Alternaria rosae]
MLRRLCLVLCLLVSDFGSDCRIVMKGTLGVSERSKEMSTASLGHRGLRVAILPRRLNCKLTRLCGMNYLLWRRDCYIATLVVSKLYR